MVAEASTQPLVEQQEEQVSVQEVQELKDTLSQAEVKTKALEAQVESLQKVRTEWTRYRGWTVSECSDLPQSSRTREEREGVFPVCVHAHVTEILELNNLYLYLIGKEKLSAWFKVSSVSALFLEIRQWGREYCSLSCCIQGGLDSPPVDQKPYYSPDIGFLELVRQYVCQSTWLWSIVSLSLPLDYSWKGNRSSKSSGADNTTTIRTCSFSSGFAREDNAGRTAQATDHWERREN